MRISNLKKLKPKEVIVFDLDGTVAPTKAPMDKQMAALITRLLAVKRVVIIGGGKYGIFKTQFLQRLTAPKLLLKNLFLFPATATSFYRYDSGWKKIYALRLTKKEKNDVQKAFRGVFEEVGYKRPQKTYGRVIEDRGTQITFSALGQDVVAALGARRGVPLKEKWSRQNRAIKMNIARRLAKLLPDLEVHAAGFTSIDITKKGIDKAYGLEQVAKRLRVEIKNMLFVGDAIFPGGNDYAVARTGVDYVPVKGPAETKEIIRALLGQQQIIRPPKARLQ